jgi:hypothetical protein
LRGITKFSEIRFEPKIWKTDPDDIIAVVNYDNGYSASIVRGSGSYGGDKGLYEIAVIYLGSICKDTYITDDVLGWLTEADVEDTLRKIKDLPMI